MGIMSGFIIGVLICIFHVCVHFLQNIETQTANLGYTTIPQPKAVKPQSKQRRTPSKSNVVKPKQARVEQVTPKTNKDIIDLVTSGLVHIGMKKSKAKSLVAKMCINKCYTCEQKLFEDCFPYINS